MNGVTTRVCIGDTEDTTNKCYQNLLYDTRMIPVLLALLGVIHWEGQTQNKCKRY